MVHPYEAPPPLPAGTGIYIWRTAIAVPIVSFIFVSARFYTRLCLLRKRLMVDDYIVAATMMISIAQAVTTGLATYHGMGLHVWQYTPELNADYYLWVAITSEFYAAGLAGFKSSLIVLYLQIFGAGNKKFRIACYVVLFYTLGYLTANILLEFLGCWPIPKFWRSDLPGHCVDRTPANTFFGIGHVTSDLIIAALPLGPIWKLKFPTVKQKIGLSLTLSSGLIAWAVATVRYVISTYDQFTYDRTWWAGIGFAFSILEVNTGLICTCVPTFSPLLAYLNKVRISHFISSWTTRASGVWDEDKFEKPTHDDLESHGNLADESRTVHELDTTRSVRSYSGGEDIVPVIYREMTMFSPIGADRERPVSDTYDRN
ncbi:hypothetical protein F4861DRAFT_541289 [Xylaria intraflava]|nr:hypothetical protein F4861DRAFT_541289 [Xylaria intraflava]